LGFVQSSGNNMLSLVNNYIDLGKTRTGSLAFHPERVLVEPLVGDVIARLRGEAAAKQVTIQTSIEPGATSLVDPIRIHSVLQELVSNAIRFTPDGGHVFI